MKIRHSKRARAGVLLILLGIPVSIRDLVIEGFTLTNVMFAVLAFSFGLYLTSAILAVKKVDDQRISVRPGLHLPPLYDRNKEYVITWDDVTFIDGSFGIFPPYGISIQGYDHSTGEEIEISTERFSPDIKELYRFIHSNVSTDLMSDEFKQNTMHLLSE
jgi:hypothetical protein